MPTVKPFASCAIQVYPRDHGVPHFHVVLADGDRCAVAIGSLEVLAGRMSPGARLAEALAWAEAHRETLRTAWEEVNA